MAGQYQYRNKTHVNDGTNAKLYLVAAIQSFNSLTQQMSSTMAINIEAVLAVKGDDFKLCIMLDALFQVY